MTSQRNVLVIAYIFPPLGGSGVQRTVKFVRHLPAFGWRPHVVCSSGLDPFHFPIDETLLAEIPPDVQVTRLPFVSPLNWRHWGKRKLAMAPRAQPGTESPRPAGGPNPPPGDQAKSQQGRSPLRRVLGIFNKALGPFEYPPVDAALYWALSIAPHCRRIIERVGIDVIFTTSFPYSDHVAGLALRGLTGKPWVADFRDPWSRNAVAGNHDWRRRCDQFVERQVLRRADRVVPVTPTYTADFRGLAPDRAAERFVTIENGYDQDDMATGEPLPPVAQAAGKVTIAHVGRVYNGTVMPFLAAVERLGPLASQLQVRFVGGLAAQEERWLAENPLACQVEVVGRVPHAEAIRAMRAAHALLLPIGDGPAWQGHYPGRLFEYMACGTPILMVGPEGDAAQLVRASGTGGTLLPGDTGAITAALALLVTAPEAFRASYFQPRPEIIAQYERRALTGKLAALFDELVEDRKDR